MYDIFKGEDLKIAELIQRRRLQMLVHSYIYYEENDNLVSDSQWSAWATELADLQKKYPHIEKQVPYRQGFEDWDGSTGAFLPYNDVQIIAQATRLLRMRNAPIIPVIQQKPVTKPSPSGKRKLF